MGRPISIGVAADTREFSQGVKRDIIKPLEDAGKSLDDVQRAGDKAGEQLEGAFEKAQREVSDFKREQADAARDTSRKWKDAGDDIGKNVKDGTSRAQDGLREFGDEGNSTAKELAASFDGSAESIAGGIQEVAANAFAGFGPAGAVAGLAAAAGLGIVTSELQKQQEEADRLKERLSSAYQAAAEEGRTYLDEAQIISEVQDLIFNPDRASEYNQSREDAKALEIDLNTVLLARAGDAKALDSVEEQIQEKRRARTEEMGAQAGTRAAGNDGEIRSLRDIENRFDALSALQDEYTGKAETALGATARVAEGVGGAFTGSVGRFGEASAAANTFKTRLREVPTDITVKAKFDEDDADGKINRWATRARSVKITADVVTPAGKRVIP